MRDPLNHHHRFGFINLVDDPVFATAGNMEPFQLQVQWLPDPLWIVRDGAVDHLEDRRSDLVWDAGQVPGAPPV